MPDSSSLSVRRYQPASRMAPHEHAEASLGVVTDGGFVERIGGEERHYRRGFAAYCPAGILHSQDFGPAGARQVIYRPEPSWLGSLENAGVDLRAATYACSESCMHLGARLLAELRCDDDFAPIAREGILLELFAVLGRTGAAVQSRKQTPAWLLDVRDFIHANAYGKLDLKRIAAVARRHEIHLAREFRRYFGLTIGGYARRLRAEEAARVLSRSRAGLSDIALACGFASHAHLCRVFKAHYGLTPSQYRSRCQT
ncbi:MAG TPA: AraC family transcriptional regulator [Steroidobacteraceae bacterium]|nr:AraC family transcriptional regulator [Steroidobacteraceae bacterium]